MTKHQFEFFVTERQARTEVSGLEYYPSFLADKECGLMKNELDRRPWLPDLKRRVQHYGYKYDYKARRVTADHYLGELPAFLLPLASRIVAERLFSRRPDQAIVNEYLPGQGISAHVDCIPCFGDRIATLSLGSACEMEFQNQETRQTKHLILEVGSLLVLSGDARYQWTHAIRPRQRDHGVARKRRVSLTFRTVRLGSQERQVPRR